MNEFRWRRKNISPSFYNKAMGIENDKSEKTNIEIFIKSDESNPQKKIITIPREYLHSLSESKYRKAYEVANDIRKFEIGLFWKRAGFFWAFIVAIYTAYYHVLTNIYDLGNCHNPRFQHGAIPLLVLSALGLFFCFSWLLSSCGSKHWQENWEKHLDLLEDKITGPLFKTYEAGKAYSESKITIAAGLVVTICSYGLVIYEFVCFLSNRGYKKGIIPFIIVLSFSLLIGILLSIYSKLMLGNTENSGSISFQTKKYGEIK